MLLNRPWKIAVLLCVTVVALVWAAAAWWLPSKEELALRASQMASERVGVGVSVGAVDWHLLPTPRVVLKDVVTEQAQPLRLAQLSVYPRLLPLLAGRVALDRVRLDGGTVVQRSLREFEGGPQKGQGDAVAPALELARLEFRDLTWISRSGVAVVYAGEADFEPGLRLRAATLRRPGLSPAADIAITRDTAAHDANPQRRSR